VNAVTPIDPATPTTIAGDDLTKRLRAEAVALLDDLRMKGVTEQDAAFIWISGIVSSFVHLGGTLEYVRSELVAVAAAQAESRAVFRKDVVDAARAQFAVLDAEVTKLALSRQSLEADLTRKIHETVKDLGEKIAAANKSANIVFQKRWNLRQNVLAAMIAGGMLLLCGIGGYAWRSYQEGHAIAGRYACERNPLRVPGKDGLSLACPLRDLVSAETLAGLDRQFGVGPLPEKAVGQ
jgi:hypothetical protein